MKKLLKTSIIFLPVLILIHLIILAKLRFTAWPETLSFPFMIEKGFLPYRDFHHVYQPLLTYIHFGFYKIFGFTPIALKIFTFIWVALTDIAIFLISRKIFKSRWLQILPLFLYVILHPLFEGNMIWFDFAATLPVLIALYFVLRWSFKKNNLTIFLSGFFISIAFLIKQQSVLFVLPVIFFYLVQKVKLKEFLFFILGGTIPLIILLVILINSGIFNDYVFWTLALPLKWFSKIPGYKVFPIKKEILIVSLMSLLPFTDIITDFIKKNINLKKILIFLMFLCALIFAYPRFSFFHLQPALAFFVIHLAYIFEEKKNILILFMIPALLYIAFYRFRITRTDFAGGIRFFGKEEKSLALYISQTVKPNDKIYLLGPSSVVYVLADRIPPKPWIENYVWHFEVPGMQEKVIEGWKKDPPAAIYWTPKIQGNWFDPGTYEPKEISDWIIKNYKKDGKTQFGVEVWYKIKK